MNPKDKGIKMYISQEGDYVTPQELADTLLMIADTIKQVKDASTEETKTEASKLENRLNNLSEQVKRMIESAEKRGQKDVETLSSKLTKLSTELRDKFDKKFSDIKLPDITPFLTRGEYTKDKQSILDEAKTFFKEETPEQTRDKLETLTEDERLDISAIKGLKDYEETINTLRSSIASIPRGGGGSGGIEVFKNGSKIGNGSAINLTGSGVGTISNDGHTTTIDLSGGGGGFTNPMTTVGDTIYGAASGTATRLAGNTTNSQLFLSSTGVGGSATAPTWQPIPALGTLVYYFTPTASSIATYYLEQTTPYSPPATISNAGVVDGQLLATFATAVGQPNRTFIPDGQYSCHLHLEKTAGTKDSQVYAEIWEVSSTGVDIGLIATLGPSDLISGVEAEYLITTATLQYDLTDTNSRIATKIYATITGGGSAPTIVITMGGAHDSRTNLPAPIVDITNYVPYTGATANVDLGAHNLSLTGQINVGTTVANPTGGSLVLSKNGGQFFLEYGAGGSDEKLWDILNVGSNLQWRAVNDANTLATSYMNVYRTGYTVDRVELGGKVNIGVTGSTNGNLVVGASGGTPGIYMRVAGASQIVQQWGNTTSYGWKWMQDEATTGDMWLLSRLADTDSPVMYFGRASSNVMIGKNQESEARLGVFDSRDVGTFTGNNNQGVRIYGSSSATADYYSLLGFTAGDPSYNLNLGQIGVQMTGSGTYMKFGTSNNYGTGITNTAMTIDPSGNVGIGATTPNGKLNISSTESSGTSGVVQRFTWGTDPSNVSWGLRTEQRHTGSSIAYDYIQKIGGVDKNVLTFLDGNVGIGTTSPLSSLQISSSTNDEYTSDYGVFTITPGVPTNGQMSFGYDVALGTHGSGWIQTIKSGVAYTNLLLNPNAGNVGIGTTTAGQKLTVVGGNIIIDNNTGYYTKNSGGSSLSLMLMDASNNTQFGSVFAGGSNILYATNDHVFYNYPSSVVTETMRITSTGRVGIGTGAPTTRLHVAGTTTSDWIQADTGINFLQVGRPTNTGFSGALQTVAGNVDAGTHTYVYTFVTPIGETSVNDTPIGPFTNDVANGKTLLQVPVSTDYRVTKRRIYRSAAGAGTYNLYFLAEIADNTTTSYLDNIPDSSLGTLYSWYRPDTTNSFLQVNGQRAGIVDGFVTTYGKQAGNSLTGGYINTFFGAQAGYGMTIGTFSTLIGSAAGQGLTTQTGNTVVGEYAAHSYGGNYGVIIGDYAMNNFGGANTGTGNVVIGSSAGYNAVAGAYGYNTLIGKSSGYSLAGTNNTFLGYAAGANETGSYKLIIDSVGRSSEATDRSDSLIYGVMNSTATSQTLQLGGGGTTYMMGSLGIGTANPPRKLSVRTPTGSVNNGFGFVDGSDTLQGTWSLDSNTNDLLMAGVAGIRFYAGSTIGNTVTYPTLERMVITTTGQVGIGAATPVASAKVEIVSTTQGFLPPRMTTTERTAISSPAEGLHVYDLTTHTPWYYDGTNWVSY